MTHPLAALGFVPAKVTTISSDAAGVPTLIATHWQRDGLEIAETRDPRRELVFTRGMMQEITQILADYANEKEKL